MARRPPRQPVTAQPQRGFSEQRHPQCRGLQTCWQNSPLGAQTPAQPSVLRGPSKLRDNAACWAFSVHPKEEASRPCFKDKLNKNLKRLAFLLTHTKRVLGLVAPASHGFQAVSPQRAICPSRNSVVSVQNGQGETSIVI